MEVGPQRRVVQCVQGRCLHLVRSHGHLSDEIFSQAIDDLPDYMRECADRLEGPLLQALSNRESDEMSGYSLWADQYDCCDNPIVAGEEPVNNDLIGVASGLRVFDVGCGTSRNAIWLAEVDAHVYVFWYGPTPEILSVAKRKAADLYLDVSLHSGDSETASDSDSDFDLARALRILSDLLKSGDRYFVSGFHPFFLLSGFRTSFSVEDDAFVAPNTTHLLSDYVRELKDVSIDLLDMLESERDPAYPGIPHTLVLSGRKCGRRPARVV